MSGLPIKDVELLDEKGEPGYFTFLEGGEWRRVYVFFDGKITGELYAAILTLRVVYKRRNDLRAVKQWATRHPEVEPLVNTVFFDPEAYEVENDRLRLAAAIAWAIATHRNKDGDRPDRETKTAAFCLSAGMD